MLRKQIQIMDLKKVQQRERSGLHSPRKSGLNSPRSEVDVDGSTSVSTPAGAPVGDVLSLAAVEEATSTVPNFLELQQEMDLTVAFKHLTQAKVWWCYFLVVHRGGCMGLLLLFVCLLCAPPSHTFFTGDL